VDLFTIGDGFTWITQDRERDIATAQKAWSQAAQLIGDANYDMVILDELNTILKYEYVDVNAVLETLGAKPVMQHVIITGRHAPDALIEAADLVSDIRPLKHPYKDQGVKGQKGIEF
jgi:cob(I)alamin adenosyltransferase